MNWLVAEVDLYHGHTMNREVGQLINADVSPLAFQKASDVAKSFVCFGVVLGKEPRARS